MKFVILGKDGPEGARLRPIHRPAHLERLQNLARQGKLILVCPLNDQSGCLIVVDVDSFEEAESFAKEDPYALHGIFQEVTIHPFHQVFPPEPEVSP